MPITSLTSDPQTLTLTLVADFPVPVERLWDAWADPRQVERIWGPEGWPATFTRHDVAVGGRSQYYMTGPDGARSHGWWRFTAVEHGRMFEVEDGFAHEDGSPNDGMPTTRMVLRFEPTETGSQLVGVSHFPSLEAMEEMAKMGMLEGIRSALGQMDDVLADLTSFAVGRAVETQILSDTQVRISRIIRGTADQVWRAHHEPELLRRWLLGPDGWSMPVCEVASKVGDTYRYEWAADDGSAPGFGFTGELLESEPPYRAVTTEGMIGMDGPSTTNEMTLTSVQGGTLLTLVVTYPDAEIRDMILGTGMTDGMEASYARLESDVLATV